MINNVGDVFSGFLFISTHISLDLLSLGSAKAYIGRGEKLNGHLMSRCVGNICTKNYQNPIIGFQVTAKNVGDVFWDTVYITKSLFSALTNAIFGRPISRLSFYNLRTLTKCAIFVRRRVRGPHTFSTYLVKIHIFH